MRQSDMHILIDGYNLIRQSITMKRFERHSLEAGRNALIAWLARYRGRKDHRITVVFDGWLSGPAQEERDYSSGIHIIYSGRGVKADDVLKRITASTDEEILVVSSDREVASYATRRGKAALSSLEFESIVNKLLTAPADDELFGQKDEVGEEDNRPVHKKGPARKLSRAQRQVQNKIRKL
ncbi:MAG: NYN domain-containing protein [Smithella sp.]